MWCVRLWCLLVIRGISFNENCSGQMNQFFKPRRTCPGLGFIPNRMLAGVHHMEWVKSMKCAFKLNYFWPLIRGPFLWQINIFTASKVNCFHKDLVQGLTALQTTCKCIGCSIHISSAAFCCTLDAFILGNPVAEAASTVDHSLKGCSFGDCLADLAYQGAQVAIKQHLPFRCFYCACFGVSV